MDSCDCNCGCRDDKKYTPAKIYNPSGQPALSYRIGTHARFKSDMLLSIPSQPTLKYLKTREDSDLSIALMDSWALVADVLTFYQERIANEGFLRTATERRSLLELARSIGYELKPGVAASTYLAFSMDTSAGSPKKATIGIGTKVQSVPAQGESAQVFETMEEIVAQQAWNEIRPLQSSKQDLQAALEKGEVVFDGTSTKLKSGDGLLFSIGGTKAAFVIAKEVVMDAARGQTRVMFSPATPVETQAIEAAEEEGEATDSILDSESMLSHSDIQELVRSPWTEQDLQSKAAIKGWPMDTIVDAINSERKKEKGTGDVVYAFRVKCGIFGSNAPKWDSLPPEQRYSYSSADRTFTKEDSSKSAEPVAPPYSKDWDTANGNKGIPVNKNSSDAFYGDDGYLIYLDNTYPNIQPGSWIILTCSSKISGFLVNKAADASVTGFAITAKATGLTVNNDEVKGWIKFSDAGSSVLNDLSGFYFRTTSVYAAPEELKLAEAAIETAVQENKILLDRMVGGLGQGRPVAISGELEGQPGVIRKEIATLASIVHFEDGKLLTTLYLSAPLAYKYERSTVKINANVAWSTHGETKEVSIGSGDPTQRFQEFPLKHSPLTYVPGETASGARSTLQISIDGIKWEEKESFEGMGHSERAFIVRRSDEGKSTIIFGDGKTGRLPPAGQENVKAKYRVGIGSQGLLAADQLSVLMTRPLGVRGVTNPLKTSGAEDPESMDDARKNAPRTVLTMDRIVSLEDYKNFAQGFAGVGKATSYMVRIGGSDVVLVAVSAEGGEELDANLREKLANTIKLYKDPAARFTVRSFQPRAFNLEAKIMVSSGRAFEDVRSSVEQALKDAFSFESRDFGQAVTISEVMSVIQGVEGVEAVDIDYLYEHQEGAGPVSKTTEGIIRAVGKEDEDGVVIPSLLLINQINLEEMQS